MLWREIGAKKRIRAIVNPIKRVRKKGARAHKQKSRAPLSFRFREARRA